MQVVKKQHHRIVCGERGQKIGGRGEHQVSLALWISRDDRRRKRPNPASQIGNERQNARAVPVDVAFENVGGRM